MSYAPDISFFHFISEHCPLSTVQSYKDHISKTADKLKSRNHLISKFTGMTWGANDSSLRTSALALCYSVAEYCCPVWARSGWARRVDSQLNNCVPDHRCLHPTQNAWLPVLANIAPPDLRHKTASDKLMTRIAAHENWPLHAEVFQSPTKRLISSHPIWINSAPIDISAQWREAWESASVVNQGLLPNPTIGQPTIGSGICWTAFGQARVSAMQTYSNGVCLHLTCGNVVNPRQWPILSTRAQNWVWMVVYQGSIL